MTDTTTHLTEEQLARAEALEAARRVLVARTPLASGSVAEPTHLHSLAVFILDGGDPWELPEAREAGPDFDDSPAARHGLAVVIVERLLEDLDLTPRDEWREKLHRPLARVLGEQGVGCPTGPQ